MSGRRRAAAAEWPAGAIDGGLVPRRPASVSAVELDGESVLYDARDGRLHLLNASAGAVWWAIDGHASVDALAHRLSERFAVAEPAMRADVVALLGVLGSERLLEPARPRPRPGDPREGRSSDG